MIEFKHSCNVLHQQNPLPVEGDQENKQVKKPSPPLRTSQGTWARSIVEKAHAFAEHLAKVFKPHPSEN
jgi:hypothetical protein